MFGAAITGGYEWLAVVMAVNTVIGLYYYLSWASRLFGPADGAVADHGPVPRPVGIAIGVAAVATVALSVAPQLVLDVAPFAVGR